MTELIEEKLIPDLKERLITQFSDQIMAEPSVLEIKNVEEDLRNIRHIYPTPPELILCIGDRITDLKTENEVLKFVGDCAHLLATGGMLFLSYHDLFKEINDGERFIPVHLSYERLLTAVREYFPAYVKVSELLYEKSLSGEWIKKVSSYYKLRISEGLIIDAFVRTGLGIHLLTNENGVVSVLGVKV